MDIMRPTSSSIDSSRINYLDGIRGGAALWVLLAHCMIWGGWYGIPLPGPLIAVDIFMILSGFLMTYHYIVRSKSEPINDFTTALKFYVRRFFRIAPAYYLSLIVAFTLGEIFLNGYASLRMANPGWNSDVTFDPKYINYTFDNFILHVTFVFGVLPEYSFSTMLPDWSLSLEMQFYLLFPILLILLRRTNYYLVTVLLTSLSIMLIFIFEKMPGIRPGMHGLFPEPSFFFVKSPVFLIGILIAESTYRDHLSSNQRRLLGMMAVILSFIQLLYNREALIIAPLSVYLLYMGYSSQGNSIFNRISRRILGGKIAGFLAETSYSVYLFHGFFISLFGGYLFSNHSFLVLTPPLRVAILFFLVSVMSYLVSYANYKFIELPFISLGKKISSNFTSPFIAPFKSSGFR